MRDQTLRNPDRHARLRAHAGRSINVGLFSAWVVVANGWASGHGTSVVRFVAVAACAAAAWLLVGGGSGFLWSYLPVPRDPRAPR